MSEKTSRKRSIALVLFILMIALAVGGLWMFRSDEAPTRQTRTPDHQQENTTNDKQNAESTERKQTSFGRKEERRQLVDKIAARNPELKNTRTLDAMRSVPRHLYVPSQHRSMAYRNRPLPIGHGQTISQPAIVAMMTHRLDLEPGESVLEIGTGSGYQASMLAEITDQVYSIEILEELAKRAKKNTPKRRILTTGDR